MRLKIQLILKKLVLVGIIVFPVLNTSSAFAAGGYSWAQSNGLPSSIYCYALMLSQTGQYGICADYGSDLYTTSDYGANWVDQTNSGALDWYGAAVSSSGQYMVGAVENGDIYRSSDYGVTWTDLSAAGSYSWGNIDISANGQVIVASENTNIHVSTDGGATWQQSTPPGNTGVYPLAISSSGQYVYTAQYMGNAYVSADYGSTWTTISSVGSGNWTSISTSPSGQYAVMSDGGNDVYISNDYGATWADNAIGNQVYNSSGVAISSDGQTIMVEDQNPGVTYGYIVESYDGGTTWTQDQTLGNGGYYSLSASGDLSRVVAASDNGPLFTGYNPTLYVPPPVVSSPPASAPSIPAPATATPVNTATKPTAPDTGYGQPGKDQRQTIILLVVSVLLVGFGLRQRFYKTAANYISRI